MLIALAVATLAAAVFVVWELRTPHPLLDLRFFSSRGLSSGSTLLLILFGVQGGVALVQHPFFQVVLGWRGLLATLGLMPMALLMMLASGVAPRLAARIGARYAMVTGLSTATAGLVLMASFVSATGGYLSILPGLIALGVGAGLAMTPSTEAITSSLPRKQQGVAPAVNDLTRELGAALGNTLLGGLLVAGYQSAISGRLDGVPADLAAIAGEGVANAAVSQHADDHAPQIFAATQEAFIAGWQQAVWVGAVVMAALVVFILLRGPRGAPALTADPVAADESRTEALAARYEGESHDHGRCGACPGSTSSAGPDGPRGTWMVMNRSELRCRPDGDSAGPRTERVVRDEPIGIIPTASYPGSMTTIGDRVRTAMQGASMQQKQLAQRVGMTPDALSRALSGHRGFAAAELAEIARELRADMYTLITGEHDPHRLVLSARHHDDHGTGERRLDGAAADRGALEDIRLAYAQAGEVPVAAEIPRGVGAIRRLLRLDFVRTFIDHLAEIDVDVVRINDLSTAYSFIAERRPVIAIPGTGNWFYENWSLGHELGHLSLGHDGVVKGTPGYDQHEAAANAFAAELLLPESLIRSVEWSHLGLPELAEFVWERGVSTEALRRRLGGMGLEPSASIAEALTFSTQKLLRRHWTGARYGDPVTRRMSEAGERRFPSWLKAAHLEQIAVGAIGKGTLAWMLEVDATSLEVDEPAPTQELDDAELDALLG